MRCLSPKNLLKAFFLLFSLMVQAIQANGQCEDQNISFTFSYLSEDTVLLLNTTTGFDEYSWTVEGGTIISEFDRSIFVVQEADGLSVCLEGVIPDSCQQERCRQIFYGHQEDLCSLTDCVWPGDANGDRKANQYDLLNIGLGFGATGPARTIHPVPHDPIYWAPSFSDDWQHALGPVNYKHFDCDGNGIVDEQDILAIERNYTPEQKLTNEVRPGAPPVGLELKSRIEHYGDSSTLVNITLDISLGAGVLPIEDLHGLALRLTFPEQPFRFQQVRAEMEPSDFFSDDVLTVEKRVSISEKEDFFDFAVTKKNTAGTTGFGKAASFRIISADIIELISSPATPFKVTIEGLLLINSKGDTIAYDLSRDTACINFIDNIVSTNQPAQLDDYRLQVAPNPNNGSFLLQTQGEVQLSSYTVFNMNGQVLKTQKIGGTQVYIQLQDFRPGWYVLKVQTNKGLRHQRVLIIK